MLLTIYATGAVAMGAYLVYKIPRGQWGVAGVIAAGIMCAAWPVMVLAYVREAL